MNWLKVYNHCRYCKFLFIIFHKTHFDIIDKLKSQTVSLIYKESLNLKLIEINRESNVKIHVLLSKKNLFMGLYSLHSFLRFCKEPPSLIIHDDGSMNDCDYFILNSKFPGVKIVTRHEADNKVTNLLDKYSSLWRAKSNFALKLFDFLILGSSDRIHLDSDILFFSRPYHILDDYYTDYKYIYGFERGEGLVRNQARSKYPKAFKEMNTGLMKISDETDKMKILASYEQICSWFIRNHGNFPFRYGCDQLIQSIYLGEERRFECMPLPELYSNHPTKNSLNRISVHYTAGFKELFLLDGLKRIAKQYL